MKFIIKLLVTAAIVVGLAKLLPSIQVSGYFTAILVALVISILNFIVRPILVVLTLPITIITLGLFLLVINVIIVHLADWLVPGFEVDGFFWTLIFSLLLALARSVLDSMIDKEKA
ncbi:phage holin family protein [Nonlabens xiamenensis]|uniref:phage holin family protein n=1 Tax=Nonlabens xiamenensis TaxID=2341043 RepID=UPI000F6070B7|nr:phage holin family protein [Nonlabens xiamenensis]